MEERVGLFYISTALFYENIEGISEMISYLKFVPYHVEHEFAYKRFKYIGWSPFFAELKEESIAPEYKIEIIERDNGVRYNVIDIKRGKG